MAAKKKTHAGKHPGGRPTKLTPQLEEDILVAIRAGCFLETAAAKAGIGKDTLHQWLKDGARGKTPQLKKFSNSVGQALGESEAWLVGQIAKAGKKEAHWQANAWLLERKFPKKYGLRVRVHIEEQLNAFLDACEKQLTPETYEQVLSIAERLGEATEGEEAIEESDESSAAGEIADGVDSQLESEVPAAASSGAVSGSGGAGDSGDNPEGGGSRAPALRED